MSTTTHSQAAQPSVSISILETRLRLLRLPQAQLEPCAFHLIRTLWFRSSKAAQQRFFSLTCNTLEVSLFAEEDLVQELYDGLGESSHAQLSQESWAALQVESHDEEPFEDSGKRIRDLAAPLAANGISILFKSTYFSDFLLVKVARLDRVCEILEETSGFTFHASDDSDDGLQSPTGTDFSSSSRPGPMTRSITGSLLLDKSSSPSKTQTSLPERRQRPPPPFTTIERANSHASDDLPRDDSDALPSPEEPIEAVTAPVDEEEGSATPSDQEGEEEAAEALTVSTHSETSLHLTSSLYLLPDELVAIGLDMTMEKIWREKLVKALFYSADLLEEPATSEDGDSVEGRPLSTDPATSGSRSRRRRSRTYQTFAQESASPRLSKTSPTAPTSVQDSPVPFFSFTSTSENASLVLDVRLLRILFTEDEQSMCFTVGGEGVAGPFRGEAGYASKLQSQSHYADGSEKRGRAGRVSDAEEWTRVEAPGAIESGRQIMKCLQLDLSSFGLDKKGIVNLVGETLSAGSVKNMFYSSTFSTACVLVSKDEIEHAQAALERLS